MQCKLSLYFNFYNKDQLLAFNVRKARAAGAGADSNSLKQKLDSEKRLRNLLSSKLSLPARGCFHFRTWFAQYSVDLHSAVHSIFVMKVKYYYGLCSQLIK